MVSAIDTGKMGNSRIDEGAKHLLKLKGRVETTHEGEPSFLMVLTSTQTAYRREDGVYLRRSACRPCALARRKVCHATKLPPCKQNGRKSSKRLTEAFASDAQAGLRKGAACKGTACVLAREAGYADAAEAQGAGKPDGVHGWLFLSDGGNYRRSQIQRLKLESSFVRRVLLREENPP